MVSTGWIFVKFGMYFSKNLSRKFKFHYNLTRISDALHKNTSTFMIIFRRILLRISNGSDKRCRENQNTHFMLNKFSWKIVPFAR